MNDTYLERRASSVQDLSSPDYHRRFNELQRRNTLVPPHLKSSYPAETQTRDPVMFQEHDIKVSLINFNILFCS